jgi:hypothetical protein
MRYHRTKQPDQLWKLRFVTRVLVVCVLIKLVIVIMLVSRHAKREVDRKDWSHWFSSRAVTYAVPKNNK